MEFQSIPKPLKQDNNATFTRLQRIKSDYSFDFKFHPCCGSGPSSPVGLRSMKKQNNAEERGTRRCSVAAHLECISHTNTYGKWNITWSVSCADPWKEPSWNSSTRIWILSMCEFPWESSSIRQRRQAGGNKGLRVSGWWFTCAALCCVYDPGGVLQISWGDFFSSSSSLV